MLMSIFNTNVTNRNKYRVEHLQFKRKCFILCVDNRLEKLIMLNDNNDNENVTGESINKYVAGLHRLSIATGKCDSALMYIEQTYHEDKFLIHSLASILKDITYVNQDSKYERTVMPHKPEVQPQSLSQTAPVQGTNRTEQPIATHKVQIPHEDIKVASVSAEVSPESINTVDEQNKDLGSVSDIDKSEYYYEFINSSNLDKMWYSIEAKLLKVMFKGNKRLYHYISVPESHIKQMIVLDLHEQSAGKYFNSNIVKNYEYRELSGEAEEMYG